VPTNAKNEETIIYEDRKIHLKRLEKKAPQLIPKNAENMNYQKKELYKTEQALLILVPMIFGFA